jgi:uncharacterized protein YdbL (DUF1318 family)
MQSRSTALAVLCTAVSTLGPAGGCVKAPNIVLVDRRTALEDQAAGQFPPLEAELTQAGLNPGPAPFTSAELAQAGAAPAHLGTDAYAQDEAGAADGLPDPLRLDGLLTQRCVGEARDGTVVLTIDTCTGTIDVARVNRLVERTNRNRRQLWDWMARRSGISADAARAAWRTVHLEGVICGAAVQAASGSWESKSC